MLHEIECRYCSSINSSKNEKYKLLFIDRFKRMFQIRKLKKKIEPFNLRDNTISI